MKLQVLLICLLSTVYLSCAAQSNEIIGYWLTDEGTSQIRIFKATNGKYYGEVAWIKDKDKRDEVDYNNPDPRLRDRKRLGLRILNGFEYNKQEDTWENGTIYDPNNGKTYDCYMWFEEGNDVLSIKGYVLGMKWLGRETKWKREENLREG